MTRNISYPIIDILRGLAILAMIAYHVGFDLNMQSYIVQDLNHNLSWQVVRNLILGTFLFVSGFSLALAQHHTIKHRSIRLADIAGCALLVSVSSYFMFPESGIFFGVLHFIVIASLLCWFLAKHRLTPLGSIILAMSIFYQSATFDQPMLQWLGLMTHKPITEDYVPIFPWLGVILIGLHIGKVTLQKLPRWPLAETSPKTLNQIGWLGSHSLSTYMLHQPILLGLL